MRKQLKRKVLMQSVTLGGTIKDICIILICPSQAKYICIYKNSL